MKLAREIATISYRSGPEWRQRFGRKRIEGAQLNLCPTFLIEQYIDHQGEKGAAMLDPNTLLYISKAMDLFELSNEELKRITMPTLGNRGLDGCVVPRLATTRACSSADGKWNSDHLL